LVRIGGSVRVVSPPAGDDLPVFDEAPLRSVEFEPQALRPAGRRRPIVVGAWALAAMSLIAIGLLAGDPAADDPPSRLAIAVPTAAPGDPTFAPGDPWPPDLGPASTRMGALLLVPAAIALDSPAPARVEVTTPKVDVLGTMLVRAARVQIALEARGNRVLDHVSIDVSNHDGGIRPEWGPTFQASFDLPFPRPNGTMWVVVTAYDERGMPLGATRQPFTAGALRPSPVALADSNPMGERWRPRAPEARVLAAPPPTCMPLSATLASAC
jgi:hypothetical protein